VTDLTSGIEPVTAFTDALLAAWTAFLAGRLFSSSKAGEPLRLWAWAFVAVTIASLAGVAYHGARSLMTPAGAAISWTAVPVATASAALLFGVAASKVWLPARARGVAYLILAGHFAIALGAAMRSDSFLVAAFAYVPVLVALLVGAAFQWRSAGSSLIASAVLTSFGAFAVQMSSMRLFLLDHNDLFHLVQAVAMYLLYRGGVAMTVRRVED
jgi:hypothetical protein